MRIVSPTTSATCAFLGELHFVEILAPYGTGIVIHSNGNPEGGIRFAGLPIEAARTRRWPCAAGRRYAQRRRCLDRLRRDRTDQPPAGFAAIRLVARNWAVPPYAIRFQGNRWSALPRIAPLNVGQAKANCWAARFAGSATFVEDFCANAMTALTEMYVALVSVIHYYELSG
jgi:hypothetical protein